MTEPTRELTRLECTIAQTLVRCSSPITTIGELSIALRDSDPTFPIQAWRDYLFYCMIHRDDL